MALGKYSRVDGRKSTSYCSTVSIVVFVSVCLIGVWMLMSSSVVPTQISDVSSTETNAATKKVTEGGQNRYEDTPGDLPDDATKQDDSPKNDQELSNAEDNQEEKLVQVNTGDETDTETEKKTEDETNGEGKNEESQNNSEEESSSGGAGSKSGDEESNSEGGETGTGGDANTSDKSDSEDNAGGASTENEGSGQTEEKPEESQDSQNSEESSGDTKKEEGQGENEILGGTQPVIMKEGTTENGNWSTQAAESANEKASQKSVSSKDYKNYKWKQCNVTAGPDYIPCLDNVKAIRKLHRTGHYEHRERHCPDEAPTCLVSLPEGYKRSIKWPKSREKIWYHNVPHTKLAEVKGHQNWVKVTGEYLTFPGGGTQFKNGALHYIDFIQESLPEISWGKRSRVLLDVGCGVASFGGYLFERDVLAMSFAPKDEHEAQVQFALERGIPAISAVMGTVRQPFPSKVFDVIHCARCRVPWHIEGGKLLLELNRLLRPGGYFVWSATPVYRKGEEDEGIWKAMTKLTKAMCWDLEKITQDKLNEVGAAFYRKPTSNECYEKRPKDDPPMCKESDDPDASWNVPLEACMHKVPEGETERTSQWPDQWPTRLEKAPYWLQSSQVGVYGKPAPEDFDKDYELWKQVVSSSYMDGLGIDWSAVRNVMDMKAVYGGFAAALKDLKLWVMNVVPITSPDTLPIIYDRGLFGVYHDWCESFNTYPRTYDLLHADHLFSQLKKKCNIIGVVAEVDRILRPEGHLIVRDDVETISELESLAKSLQWKVRLTYSKDNEGLLCVQKTSWRPAEIETVEYAIGTF